MSLILLYKVYSIWAWVYIDFMLYICTPCDPWICMFPSDCSGQRKVRMGDACTAVQI